MVREIPVIDNLDILEASTVVQGNESDGAGITVGTNPALQEDGAKGG